MLRAEIRRAFGNGRFIVAVIVSAGVIVYGYVDSWQFYQIAQSNPQFGYHPYYYNAYEVFLLALTLTPFALFALLGAAAPFADSLVADRESGYVRYAVFRAGYWRFLGGKLIANWLAGATAVALAMALAFVVACFLFPVQLPPLYVDGVKVSIVGIPHSPLSHIFETAPGLYILSRIGLGFLFGGAYATLGFAISSVAGNRYVVLAAPLIVFVLSTLLIDLLGLYGWIPPVALTPEVNVNSSALTISANYIVVYGASLLFALLRLNDIRAVKDLQAV